MAAMSKNDFMRYKLLMSPDLKTVRGKLAQTPDDPDLWYELGMALSASGDDEAAVNAFSHGLILAPFDPFLHFARGRKLSAAGHFWPAVAELTLASRLDATEWTFLYYRATTYSLHGMYEQACEDFKDCLRIAGADESCPMVHWLFTTYLLELKDPQRAAQSLKLIPLDITPPQMDYGYHRCFKLYTQQVSKEDFIDIPEMEEKCLKAPGRIDLELNTMYYGLFAYCVFTGDEEGADEALNQLIKIANPNAFGYKKATAFARQRGLIH